MTTTTTNRTGSDTVQPASVHDKINLRDYLKRIKKFHWRDINSVHLFRNAYGVSYAVAGMISGDINYQTKIK